MTFISAAAEVITQSESRPEATLEVTMSDPWPSLVLADGNVSPSSDSGLGSEDEQLSHMFENLGEVEAGGLRPMYELTRALTTDTELTTPEIRDIGGTSPDRQDSSCESESSENLSLLLTSQNPSRIDVKTLKRSKVSCLKCAILVLMMVTLIVASSKNCHTPTNVICVCLFTEIFIVFSLSQIFSSFCCDL